MAGIEVVAFVGTDRLVWLLAVEGVTDLLGNQGYDIEPPTRTIL